MKLIFTNPIKGLLLLCFLVANFSAPGQILDLRAVYPKYGMSQMELEWLGAADATDFQVRKKINDGEFGPWLEIDLYFVFSFSSNQSSVAWTDPEPINSNDTYTYQVRQNVAFEWSEPSNARGNKMQKVWPVAQDGNCTSESVEVMTGFNQPVRTGIDNYLHEGLDIHGVESFASECVMSPVGGKIEHILSDNTGTAVEISVSVGPNGERRYIILGHLKNIEAAIVVGNSVQPGDKLGLISNTAYGKAPMRAHTHCNYAKEALSFFATAMDPHLIWDLPAYRDPHSTPPKVEDTNDDGKKLRFRQGPNKTTYFDDSDNQIYQESDIVVEAFDEQSVDAPWAAPKSVGYSVQRFNGNSWVDAVNSNASPYLLYDNANGYLLPARTIAPNDPVTNAMSDRAEALKSIAPVTPLEIDSFQQQWWTYIVTNSSGTDGTLANLDANQCWATDARNTVGTGNGYQDSYARARIIDEAKFPDGEYRVNIHLSDWTHPNVQAYQHNIVVNNFRPYVKRFDMEQAGVGAYSCVRDFNPVSGILSPFVVESNDGNKFSRCKDIKIKITMSEPMQIVQVTISGIDPFLHNCTAVSGSDFRIWEFTIPKDWIEDLAVNSYNIEIRGIDKSGEEIQGFSDDTTPIDAASLVPKHQHDGTWLPDIPASKDVAHSFEIASEKLALEASGDGVFTVCNTNPTVTLHATATGGTEPYDFNWIGPGNSIQVSSSGQHTATVEDRGGCKAEASAYVVIIEVDCRGSGDPNQILGPDGFDTPRWVSKNDVLAYHVDFENDPALANAPAQRILVEVPVDPDFQLNTFKVGGFGFANLQFEVPENRSFYQTRVDATSTTGVLVDLTAGIDIVNRKAFWILQSVDPATGLPPTDALMGLLPVNDTLTNNGQGFVEFTIKPSPATQTGDTVTARADIFFDQNEVVPTNVWSNLIDALPPTTALEPLGFAETNSSDIPLTWTAQDDAGGSGLREFEIYSSLDGAPFSLYQKGILDNFAVFNAQPGHDYRLYVIGIDNTGNREVKTMPEAEFHVNDAPFLDILSLSGGLACGGDSIQAQWLSNQIDSVEIAYQLDGAGSFTVLSAYQPDSVKQFSFPVPDLAGQHTLKVKIRALDAGLTEFADSLTIDIFEKVNAEAGANISLCLGDSVAANATGGTSFLWIPSLGLSDKNVANPLVNASRTTTYTVLVQNSFGCADSDTLRVEVHPTDTVFVVSGGCITAYDTTFQVFSNQFGCDSVVVLLTPVDADGDGFSLCQNDCNDADGSIHPNATETCDGIDQNCNGMEDENCGDIDGDGHTAASGDCNDNNASIFPGAPELCNGLDDDCDNLVDQADPGLVDNDPPTAACKPAHLTLQPDGTASLAAAAVNDGSTDNCTAAGDLVLAVWPNTFGCADAGTAMATLTVADGMGNTASCTATVTVLDVLYHAQEVQRMAADGLAGDNLGWGIGLDGPTAIAGAPYDKVGTQSKQGSAYVFLQNQGGPDNWGQIKQIKASDGAAVDYFGNAISMDGGLALVAAHGDNVGATADAGSVYVFEQNLPTGNNWGQQANIIARNGAASDAAAYDYFGNAVSLQNGRAIVGAAKKKVGTNNAQGAAYIYEQNAGGPNAWGNVKKLTAPDGAANNFFGQSVTQSGDLALVGANGHLGNRGAAYLFDGGAAWAQVQKLMASDAAVGDGFGASVSMSSIYAAIGAPNKAGYTGAAYVFKNDAGTWSQAKKLVASDGAANDRFGTAVALSGDYAYVTAVRGNANAGAVYVFHKDAGGVGNWGQIGRYTAADGASGDQFGYALGVSGEHMALGANLDDVGAKADQGSIYIFKGEDCPDAPRPESIVLSQSHGLDPAPSVQCWPNPFRDELAIEVIADGAVHLTVTDAAGRVMASVGLPAGQVRFDLNTSEFRAGLYFVQVTADGSVRVLPIALVR